MSSTHARCSLCVWSVSHTWHLVEQELIFHPPVSLKGFSRTPVLSSGYSHPVSDCHAALSVRNPSSEYRFSFFSFYFFLILLPSTAAQVHLQLEIGGWCKAHQQNHNCHGNCRGIWQKILQTHILWNTERFTWSSIVQSFGGSLNETDIDLYVKVVLVYFDPVYFNPLFKSFKLSKSLLLSGNGLFFLFNLLTELPRSQCLVF